MQDTQHNDGVGMGGTNTVVHAVSELAVDASMVSNHP